MANQKGGVGKTTVCINLAIEALHRTKRRIALLDLDPQRSLQTWFELRSNSVKNQSKRLSLVNSNKTDFTLELDCLRDEGHDLVFVDTPPVDKSWMAKVIAVSDLVIVPTKGGPFDFAAAQPIFELTEAKNVPVRWLLSGVILNKAEVREVAAALLKTARICPGIVKELGDVVRATQLGLGVSEFNSESAASKAYQLNWFDLENALSRISVFKHKI